MHRHTCGHTCGGEHMMYMCALSEDRRHMLLLVWAENVCLPLTLCLSWKLHPSASHVKEWSCWGTHLCMSLLFNAPCCLARSRGIVAVRPKLNRQCKLYQGHLPSPTWFPTEHSLGWKLACCFTLSKPYDANVIQKSSMKVSSWRSFLQSHVQEEGLRGRP